jgi:hypothetical protein
MTNIVAIDHETGDLTQYTSTVTDGGDLSAAAGAALAGTAYGLSCLIDDQNDIYGVKSVTMPATALRIRFYIDINSLTMTSGDEFYVLRLLGGSYTLLIIIVIKGASTYSLSGQAYRDAGDAWVVRTGVITDEPHYAELLLTRATNNTSADGTFAFYIDGAQVGATNTIIDNYDNWAQANALRFGCGWLDAGTSGTLYLDELIVNDTGDLIGPVAPGATTYAPRRALLGAGR